MKKLLLLVLLCWTVNISAQEIITNVTVMGTVSDTNGKPIPGVAVTDGWTVVATDAEGKYYFQRNKEAAYVYISLPAEYEVPLRNGIPCFYKKLTYFTEYNFILKPLKGGAEKDLTMFFMADPQCQNIKHVTRFRTETVRDIHDFSRKYKNCYAVTLGDIAYSEGPCNAVYLLPLMKEEMDAKKLGMPVFQTIGNHDNEYQPCALNELNSNPTIRYQRTFEAVFGPVNYSWNRGDVHIISMNNVIYKTLETSRKYAVDFLDYQMEWLRQDLALVPKNKLIIFCVHIPVENMKKKESYKKLMGLLQQFPSVHIMSGHTHFQRNFIHSNDIYEHITAAASGCWWWSRNNGDGTPNGYAVYTIKGNRITNWFYKSVGFSKEHQIRLYRGDMEMGGSYETLRYPFSSDTLLANVWNADEGWKIEVYEDGKYSGEMKLMKTSPYRGDEYPSMTSSKDWWAIGYNVGVVGRGHIGTSTRKNYCTPCHHMYTYKLKNPAAKVKVVATDSWGHVYSESIITTDYTQAAPPKYVETEVW